MGDAASNVRVLGVVGSRGWVDYAAVESTIDALRRAYPSMATIVSGGARGADAMGARYAASRGLAVEELRPDWSQGRGAGMARNSAIVARADAVVAFWDGASRGTADTIRKVNATRKPLRVVTPHGSVAFSSLGTPELAHAPDSKRDL